MTPEEQIRTLRWPGPTAPARVVFAEWWTERAAWTDRTPHDPERGTRGYFDTIAAEMLDDGRVLLNVFTSTDGDDVGSGDPAHALSTEIPAAVWAALVTHLPPMVPAPEAG